jgi:hypothetical protein
LGTGSAAGALLTGHATKAALIVPAVALFFVVLLCRRLARSRVRQQGG